MLAELFADATGLDTDQPHALVVQESGEQADSVAAAADAGDRQVRPRAPRLAGELLAGLLADTIASGSVSSIVCATGTFDTTDASGSKGSSFDRYSSAGAVLDENRVFGITTTTTPSNVTDTLAAPSAVPFMK